VYHMFRAVVYHSVVSTPLYLSILSFISQLIQFHMYIKQNCVSVQILYAYVYITIFKHFFCTFIQTTHYISITHARICLCAFLSMKLDIIRILCFKQYSYVRFHLQSHLVTSQSSLSNHRDRNLKQVEVPHCQQETTQSQPTQSISGQDFRQCHLVWLRKSNKVNSSTWQN